jgi:flagellar motor switch protein FliN/FliY
MAETWLISELASNLASVFEMMTGQRPLPETADCLKFPGGDGLLWRQSFNGAGGEFWLFAAAASASGTAKLVLQAAGMGDYDEETSKSTYLETINQGLSGLARAISAKLEREVTPSSGSEQTAPPSDLKWFSLTLQFSSGAITFHGASTADLSAQFGGPAKSPSAEPPAEDGQTAGFVKSKTFGLLLDVELPVSVSFGRAQVQLKDVLKLTTGSIVELNRAISEPVEVIVNNCVIARGEVVVVEGNFGIRIQEVVSREERLRTLY